MTFMDWVTQTYQETDLHIPKETVRTIMLVAIRVFIEELMADKEHASIDIKSFGRFYLNGRLYKKHELKFKEDKYVWTLHFRPSQALKNLINERTDLEDYMVANHKLYSNEIQFFRRKKRFKKRGLARSNCNTKYNMDLKELLWGYGYNKTDLSKYMGLSYNYTYTALNRPNLRESTREEFRQAIEDMAHGKEYVRRKPKKNKKRKRNNTKRTRKSD